MQHRHKLAIALGFLTLLGAVEVAQAKMKFFPGTRSQVKSACVGAGRELVEGTGMLGIPWSMCLDSNTNIGVICDGTGGCIASGSGLRVAGTKPGKPRPRHYEPPESLSEPSGGTEVGEIGVDIPAPEPDVEIIN